jgi:hypothetical protein
VPCDLLPWYELMMIFCNASKRAFYFRAIHIYGLLKGISKIPYLQHKWKVEDYVNAEKINDYTLGECFWIAIVINIISLIFWIRGRFMVKHFIHSNFGIYENMLCYIKIPSELRTRNQSGWPDPCLKLASGIVFCNLNGFACYRFAGTIPRISNVREFVETSANYIKVSYLNWEGFSTA